MGYELTKNAEDVAYEKGIKHERERMRKIITDMKETADCYMWTEASWACEKFLKQLEEDAIDKLRSTAVDLTEEDFDRIAKHTYENCKFKDNCQHCKALCLKNYE